MDFCVSLQERPKSSHGRPKSGQGRHKSGQEEPKSDQERPKSGQERPKSGQERPKAAQSGPRVAKSGSCCRARCRTKDVTSRRHRPLGLYNIKKEPGGRQGSFLDVFVSYPASSCESAFVHIAFRARPARPALPARRAGWFVLWGV